VSLLLSLGAVELSIRIVDPLGISYYEVSGEYTRDKLADDHLYLPAQIVLVKFHQRYQFGYRIPAKPLMTLIS
jgi:hypothetical protein